MINIVELFSGIGSQARAFEKLSARTGVEIKVLNTCEWDIHAIVAYDYIHNGTKLDIRTKNLSRQELIDVLSTFNLSNDGKKPINKKFLLSLDTEVLRIIYSSILKSNNLISVTDVKGQDLPNDITVLTYSFPCQDLSNVGALHGYNKGIDRDGHTRSGLLWEVERILLERQKLNLDMPKFLLLENVTALEAKRHNKNFLEWQNRLKSLGYINVIYKLYAPDFGIPQNRKRLLMLSVYVGNDAMKNEKVNEYLNNHNLADSKYVESLGRNKFDLSKFLRLDYSIDRFFIEALESQPNDTLSRKTIWERNSQIVTEKGIVKPIVQTITTKQDRHPNSGNIYFDKNPSKAGYRFLTPRECFLLMGFSDQDYDALTKNNFFVRKNSYFFSRDRLYKLAGNSIVVNMLEAIFEQVIDLNLLINCK